MAPGTYYLKRRGTRFIQSGYQSFSCNYGTQYSRGESDPYRRAYWMAPVSLLRLNRGGVIQEANLHACSMFNSHPDRMNSGKKSLADFIRNDHLKVFFDHVHEVFEMSNVALPVHCTLPIRVMRGEHLSMRMQSVLIIPPEGPKECLSTLFQESPLPAFAFPSSVEASAPAPQMRRVFDDPFQEME